MTNDMTIVDDLLEQVRDERETNIKKWGVQTHESYRGEEYLVGYKSAENAFKAIWENQNAEGRRTWDVILLEEVYEALSETDPEMRVAELIQVAAMALAEAESIIRREGRLTGPIDKPEACFCDEQECSFPHCTDL